MNNETRQIFEYSCHISAGILKHFDTFKAEQKEEIIYNFDCPEYNELVLKYNLVEIAGKGNNFTKAKRILNYFAPKLAHKSDYDNHVPCNALDLLEYCFEKPENGINCLNKSKIFAECCLALGIPARRIIILAFSPYDNDNHVVTEIYDDLRDKWVMMDMTEKNYFIDEEGMPLSMLEIREHFANNKFITCIDGTTRSRDYKKLAWKNGDNNWYICKNSFYFIVDKYQEFGADRKDYLYFIPEGFEVRKNEIENLVYRIETYGDQMPEYKKICEEEMEKSKNKPEPVATNIEALRARV